MKYTPNYGFKKPEPTDTVNVNDFSDSFELVDQKLKETQDKNTNLDATFRQLIINAGSSNAEIAASRHDNVTGETYDSVPDRLDANSAQLAQKVNQVLFNAVTGNLDFYTGDTIAYSIALAQAISNQDIRDYIDTLVANNTIAGVTIQDSTVLPKMTTYFKVIFNYFNITNVTSGTYIQNDGSTGTNSYSRMTEAMTLPVGTYKIGKIVDGTWTAQSYSYAIMNSSNAVITYTFGSSFTITDASYHIFIWKFANSVSEAFSGVMIVKSALTITEYCAYGETHYLSDDNIIRKNNIKDSEITHEKTAFFTKITNYFNVADVTSGTYIADDGSEAINSYSRMIAVTLNAGTYKWGKIVDNVWSGYNLQYAIKNGSTKIAVNTSGASSVTIAVDGYTLYLWKFANSVAEVFDGVMLINSGIDTNTYYAYGMHYRASDTYKTSQLENDKGYITSSETEAYRKLKGKMGDFLGDSHYAQGRITSAIVAKTGLVLTNYGVSGTLLADTSGTQTEAICHRVNDLFYDLLTAQPSDWATNWTAYFTKTNHIYSNVTGGSAPTFATNTYYKARTTAPYLIEVIGGSNDCNVSTIGTAGDTTNTTVAGAVYNIIKAITEKFPSTILVFNTMPYRWVDNTYEAYANIVKSTCEKYGIPCVDLWHNAGFNQWNGTQYSLDNMHLNDSGAAKVASINVDMIMRFAS